MPVSEESELKFSDCKHNLNASIQFMQALLDGGVIKDIPLKLYMTLIGQLTGLLDGSWQRGQAGKGEMQPPAGKQLEDFVRNTQYIVMDKPKKM